MPGEVRILIHISNHDYFCKLSTMLVSAGYVVVYAIGIGELMDKLHKNLPQLIIMDSGEENLWKEACERVREDHTIVYTPILLLSSLENACDDINNVHIGVDGYIVRPFNLNTIVSKIDSTIYKTFREFDTNPLTRLPGNNSIREEVEEIIDSGKMFAVCYADMDNFKIFNDHYGFAKGDEAINTTAHIIVAAVKKNGNPNDFIGHIGGDDFVFVTTPEKVSTICEEIVKNFDTKITVLYEEEDLGNNLITHKNRQGIIQDFAIMTLSIGVVTNKKRKIKHFGEVSQIGTEMKVYAKNFPGSKFIVDARNSRKSPQKMITESLHDPVWNKISCKIFDLPPGAKDSVLRSVSESSNDLRKIFKKHEKTGMLLLKIFCLPHIVVGGSNSFIPSIVDKIFSEPLPKGSNICKLYWLKHENSFVSFIDHPKAKENINAKYLEESALNLKIFVEEKVASVLGSYLCKQLGFYAGYTILQKSSKYTLDRVLFHAIRNAQRVADNARKYDVWRKSNVLREIILEKKVRSVFQAVIDLKGEKLLGYEAFSRGPAESELENPVVMFDIAGEAKVTWALETLCHKTAFESTPKLRDNELFFVNINSNSVVNPRLLEEKHITNASIFSKNIMWELKYEMFKEEPVFFMDTFRYLRDAGFGVTVDNVDSADSPLPLLAELKPDFIKIDISLVRDIANKEKNSLILRTISEIFRESSTKIIAKGIETKEELHAIEGLGISYGQGFYFSSKEITFSASGNVSF